MIILNKPRHVLINLTLALLCNTAEATLMLSRQDISAAFSPLELPLPSLTQPQPSRLLPGQPAFCQNESCILNNRPDYFFPSVCDSNATCDFLPITYPGYQRPVNLAEPDSYALLITGLLFIIIQDFLRRKRRSSPHG